MRAGDWLVGCCSLVAEHWELKPGGPSLIHSNCQRFDYPLFLAQTSNLNLYFQGEVRQPHGFIHYRTIDRSHYLSHAACTSTAA